uniref:Uncharacterized protein n=1 Tax=Setaria italica TaxID=4555 RepID=K3ZBR2_SETIT
MNLYNLFKLSLGKNFRMLARRYELHLYLLLQKRECETIFCQIEINQTYFYEDNNN